MLFNKKNLLSFVLFFSHLSISPTSLDYNDYLDVWKTTYIDHMSLPEKQMVANIIHLLHANAIIEFKIREFLTPIVRLNQSIRTSIEQYKSVSEDVAMLKTLIERLSIVINTRTIYNQTLNTCITHYNNHTSLLADAALADLQLYAQTILRTWTNEKAPETAAQLKKCSENIYSAIQHFQGVTQLHKIMSENKLPFQISSADEENRSLITLSILSKNNPEILSVTDHVINSLNETSDFVAQIIPMSIQLYRKFYTVLYNELISLDSDKRYATTLFGMYNILPNEYRSLLPDPDHTFEHMLQTVKMYTQTEFSQS